MNRIGIGPARWPSRATMPSIRGAAAVRRLEFVRRTEMSILIRSLACAAALMIAAGAQAAELSPSDVVKELYRLELGPKGDMTEEPLYSFTDAHIQRLMTRSFQSLVAKMSAYQLRTNEAILDWDPIADGNGAVPLDVKIEALPPSGAKATAVARFHDAGDERHEVNYRFLREGGAWKVDDIFTKTSDIRQDILHGLGGK
jgi:hypothetical protein